MKVVFDTNVFISAFLVLGGQGEQALLLDRRKHFVLYTSVAILTETAQKLRDKFDQSEEDIRQALKLISHIGQVLRPSAKLNLLTDGPDNRIIECALAARADLVVTGDRHLLRLRQFQTTSIVRLADFLRMFPEQTTEKPHLR